MHATVLPVLSVENRNFFIEYGAVLSVQNIQTIAGPGLDS
jgi:hypothetical protein